jgi:hypothetical protein
MFERAQATANKRRLIPQPGEKDKGDVAPKTKTMKRMKPAKPARPSTKVPKATMAESAETERGMSISQALLKGAAMVPESGISGTLRGLLGGASVGIDLNVALERYRQRKKEETAANAAMQMGGGS